MKKQYHFIAALMLGLFSSVSSAATHSFTNSFYAYGGNDSVNHPEYLHNTGDRIGTGTGTGITNISIDYPVMSSWTNISAKLWLKGVDDGHCIGQTCVYNNDFSGHDSAEKALIINIEGLKDDFASKEINTLKWYDLKLDVTAFLLHDINHTFNAILQVSEHADFWFLNAKLVVDYDLKPVPVPAAIWLFGSALLGLTGLKRKSIATTVAA
jgi:hypothetical protein